MGQLRITGGHLARRRLNVSKGAEQKGLRPTGDRVREALFSSLGSRGLLEGACVLDAFAGTGVLSIEALSRGATFAFLIERQRTFAADMRKTLEGFSLKEKSEIFVGDALSGMKSYKSKHGRADIIFFDPPYADEPQPALLAAAEAVLAPKGLLLFERQKGAKSELDWGLFCTEVRAYGSSQIATYAHHGVVS